MYCPQCGSKAVAGDRFCRACGVTLALPQEYAVASHPQSAYQTSAAVAVAAPPLHARSSQHPPATGAAFGEPVSGIGTAVKIILYISATGAALVGLTNGAYAFWGYEILNDGWGPSFSTIELANDLEALGIWVYVLGLVAGAICWMIWQHRVAARAIAAAPDGSTYAPHAIWFWLIPIANLFVPYQAITSYYRIGAGRSTPPSVFRWWWGMWLAGSLLWLVGLEIQSNALWLEEELPAYFVTLLSGGLIAAAAFLAVRIVRSITAVFAD